VLARPERAAVIREREREKREREERERERERALIGIFNNGGLERRVVARANMINLFQRSGLGFRSFCLGFRI
jgi:hypothetical protein